MQNNHIYKDLVEYFGSEVLLNLGSQVNIWNASTISQIAYLLTVNLWDSTKPKILPTFDIQYPVDSTSTKSVATVRQLLCINPDTVCCLPYRSATSNTTSNSAPTTPVCSPLPTILILSAALQICHVEDHVNSASTTPARSLSSSLSNLPAPCGSYEPSMALYCYILLTN